MHLQIRQESVEALLVRRRHLETDMTRVDRRRPEVQFDDPVPGACVDDHIEHLGQEQRVHDVAVEAHDLTRLCPSIFAGAGVRVLSRGAFLVT